MPFDALQYDLEGESTLPGTIVEQRLPVRLGKNAGQVRSQFFAGKPLSNILFQYLQGFETYEPLVHYPQSGLVAGQPVIDHECIGHFDRG